MLVRAAPVRVYNPDPVVCPNRILHDLLVPTRWIAVPIGPLCIVSCSYKVHLGGANKLQHSPCNKSCSCHSGGLRSSTRITAGSEEVALFWNASVLVQGGQYRLCWCSEPSGCTTEADFVTDVGRLDLVGVSPRQHRTCTSGQTCEFDGITGQYLSNQDVYLVADTCATTLGLRRFLGSSSFSTSVTESGARVSFGSVPVTAAGGHFMLCWCSGTLGNGCSSPAHFQVIAGTLSLLGPAPLQQDKTCISGHTCSFEMTSHLPHGGNSFLIADTCGTNSLPPRLPMAPFRSTMYLSSFSVGFIDADGDGVTACGGDECFNDPNKIYGGICGCDVPDVDTDGDGLVDCLDWCPLDPNKTLPGYCGCGDAEQDTDGDGVLDCADKCPLDPTKTNPQLCGCGVADTDSDIDGTPDCYDNCPSQPDSVAGVCQCAASFADDDADGTPNCNDLCPLDPLKLAPGPGGCGTPDTDTDADGTVDYLDMCPLDANKIEYGDCGCGVSDIDSDSDGLPDCVDACPLDADKNLTGICGCGISDEDPDGNRRPICFPDCPPISTTSPYAVSVAGLGIERISTAGGQYRLCWCAGTAGASAASNGTNTSSNETAHNTCSYLDEFKVDFGGLLVMGVAPLRQSKTCVTGSSCIIEGITGHGLSPSDGYMILDTCGVPSGPRQTLLPFESLGNASNGWSITRRWVADVQVSGGLYRLCWCADHFANRTSWCQHAKYNTVDFGTMSLIGPELSVTGWTCVSGQTCVMDAIAGNGLSSSDALMVLETCGTPFSNVGLRWRPTLLEVLSPLHNQGRASWHHPLSAPGGDFRLCLRTESCFARDRVGKHCFHAHASRLSPQSPNRT